MSLTTCLKKMGATISPKDRAAILSLARGYRSQGLAPTAAAIQAVSDQIDMAQSRLTELSERPVESVPLASKRADTPQTETENFKRWFGDSKVVDAQGKPLVVYHGTERDFDAFKVGSAVGWGRGIYFTDNQEYTREFGDRTVAAYVKIENPWRGGIPDGIESTNAWRAIADRWDYFEDAWQEDSGFVGDVLRELGYDGVIAKDSNDVDGLEVVAFRPTQIKSAIGNNGDFDPSKPSILASKRTRQDAEKDAEPTPRFNSATEFWTNNNSKRATTTDVATDETVAGNQGRRAAGDDTERDAEIDATTGLPLNDDGTVTVYHHTSRANAEAIRRSGTLKAAGEPDVYVTTRRETDTGYGDTAVPIRVDPGQLAIDDEFPDGRKDFRLSVGRPGGSIKVAVENDPSAPGRAGAMLSRRTANDQTQTPAFRKWFGDSKVVDADGKPLVVYHGSGTKGVQVFDPDKAGSIKTSDWGEGVYFTPARWQADGYREDAAIALDAEMNRLWTEYEAAAKRLGTTTMMASIDLGYGSEKYNELQEYENRWRDHLKKMRQDTSAGEVYAAYVKLENPLIERYEGMTDPYLARRAKEAGHDGIIIKKYEGQFDEIVVFRPNQIKSATGNSGTFDPNNPSILASKRTRQDAEKDAEPTPRFNSATEFWTNNIGKPLFNMISRATKSVVANDFLKRHGLNLAEDMPPEAQKAWRAYKQDVGNLKKTVSEIADEAKKLTPEERAMVSDLVEREMKAGVTPPEAVIRMATLMTSIMRKQSQQLVETGMLSKDAADRWEGRYLPRFYQKHLLTNPFNTMLRKAYLSGIKGTHLKGRGLFETIPVEDVPAYEKMGWEVRDPEHGKKPSLKGLPEGSKVRVWRDFTPAERQKMGEVRDAMYRFARGYTDTQIDIAKGKLFDHIARTVARDDNPGGSYVLVPDTSVPGTGVKKFGNLAGKYVPGDVLSALKTKAGPDSDITRAYLKALSLWKEGKTSLNPVTHVNNVVSNLVMSDLAGVNLVDPRSWKLYADTFNDYRKEGTWFKEAQKAGMFGGEWYGNEVAQWLPLPSELKDSGPRSIPGKFAMKAVDAIGSVRRGMGKMYQAEDQFFKLLLYKQARERGLEPNDAVTWANKFVFDYSTAAPGVTKLKNTLFPFANYSSKAVPALTFAATHYPWRIAKWIGLLSGFSLYAFNTLYGDDEAEEMAESEAAMMPDYLKGRSSFFGVPKAIRLPYDDESTGDGMYVDISRFVPLGDLFDAENQSGGVPLPAPLTPNNPIITTAIAMLANKDSFTGKDIVRDSDTGGEAAQKRIGWLYRQMAPNNPLVPGSYNFNRIGQAVSAMAGEPIGPYTGLDYNGNTISPARALAQTFGIKLRSVDFEKEMHFQELDLKREISDLKGQKTKLKKNQSISDETLERELDKLDVKIEAVQTRLYDLQDIPIPQR